MLHQAWMSRRQLRLHGARRGLHERHRLLQRSVLRRGQVHGSSRLLCRRARVHVGQRLLQRGMRGWRLLPCSRSHLRIDLGVLRTRPLHQRQVRWLPLRRGEVRVERRLLRWVVRKWRLLREDQAIVLANALLRRSRLRRLQLLLSANGFCLHQGG